MKCRNLRGLAPALLSVVLLGGCATAGTAGTTTNAASGRSELLTRQQIMSVRGAGSLYDVVQRLRPQWLARGTERGFDGPAGVVVYRDQTLLGGVDALRSLQPTIAYGMQYVDGSGASGTLRSSENGYAVSGIIYISTRRHAP